MYARGKPHPPLKASGTSAGFSTSRGETQDLPFILVHTPHSLVSPHLNPGKPWKTRKPENPRKRSDANLFQTSGAQIPRRHTCRRWARKWHHCESQQPEKAPPASSDPDCPTAEGTPSSPSEACLPSQRVPQRAIVSGLMFTSSTLLQPYRDGTPVPDAAMHHADSMHARHTPTAYTHDTGQSQYTKRQRFCKGEMHRSSALAG